MKRKSEIIFDKSVREALGYIELAKMQAEIGADNKVMRDAAIAALRQFTDNDDLIDEMYEEDMNETRCRII